MKLVVAIHDVTPANHDAACEWRRIVAARVGGPVSLLVVPRYGGDGGWYRTSGLEWLRRQAAWGDEIVAHGLTHTTVTGADGAEFRRRRPLEVVDRVSTGVAELGALGLPVAGFVSPAYVHPASVSRGCELAGLSWWATRMQLHWSGAGRRWLPSLGVGASTVPRRVSSPAAVRFATVLAATAPVVRLDLHPADLEYPALASAGRRALDLLLGHNRALVVHRDLVTRPPWQVVQVSGPVRGCGAAHAA